MVHEQMKTTNASHHGPSGEEAAMDTPQGVEKTEGIDEDVDNILADIDDVLETNAEEFVKSYIQKGGE